MTIKYKIGFTVDAQTLFAMLSKFLPFEHLSVQEIVEHDAQPPKLPRARHVDGLDLTRGINLAIMAVLADGEPHRYRELKKAASAAGYAASGIGSRLKRLRETGAIVNVGPGLWRAQVKEEASQDQKAP